MKVHTLQQGSEAWHELRSQYLTASEAPAMMGDSKYMTRDDLIHQKATGYTPEVSPQQQRLFDKGHAAEAAARPFAEEIIDDELFPITASEGRHLASMDGITMTNDVGWEHKLYSESLAHQVKVEDLEKHYIWQLEQQAMVTGCEKILFMCSDGTRDKCKHLWYFPDTDLQDELKAGWAQFDKDLEVYKAKLESGEVEQHKEATAEAIKDLPAITYQMNGLALTSNLKKFEDQAQQLIEKSRQPLETDDDFATAESLVKVFKQAEDKIDALAEQVLGEVQDIDAFTKDLKQIKANLRQARLDASKKVTSEKDRRRQEIARKAQHELNNHIQSQQAKLDGCKLPTYNADFAGAMSGKKTMKSLQSAVNDRLAQAKIDINQQADEGAANLATLNQLAADHKFLFADLQHILFKPQDDFTALIKSRIADHKQAEEQRLEAERVRQEEAAKANKEKPAPEPEEEPLPAAAEKPDPGKLSGVVNPDLVNNEINSIVKYMTDEGFPLKHIKAIASIVYAFNESEQSEKEIFAFAHSIKKKYGVAA